MESAPPIFNLEPYQRLSATRALILKISVITGWAVPQGDMMTVFADQFLKLLLESYPILNVVEVEYAFRHYGTKIKDWGKEMNLSLITAVLDTYWGERSEVVEYARKSLPIASESHIWTDDDFDNEMRGKIEAYFQFRKEGKKNPLWLNHWTEILIKDGFIKKASQKDAFFEWALKAKNNLYQKA